MSSFNLGGLLSMQPGQDYASSDWYRNAVAFKERYGREAFQEAWKSGQLGNAAPPDEPASQWLSTQLARWQDADLSHDNFWKGIGLSGSLPDQAMDALLPESIRHPGNNLVKDSVAAVGTIAGGSYLAGAGGGAAAGGTAAGGGAAAAGGGDLALGGGGAFGTLADWEAGTSALGGTGGGMAGFDLGGGLTVDEFGNITGGSFEGGPGTPGSGDFFDPGGGGLTLPNFGNLNLGGLFSGLGDAAGNFDLGGLLPSKQRALSVLPGAMALAYALKQPGLDVGQLNAILGSLGGNQDAIVRAATDPVQANIAAGYGDLLQSQSKRGIRGSSFGDTDIGNYLATTGRSLGNTAANAAEGSLALQGSLATNIAALKNQGQQIKNGLFGRAFDVLGRGLNPAGYGSNINIGGNGGTGAAPGGSGPTLPLSSLLRLGSGLWSGVKGGLGGLFGGGGGDTAGAGDLIDFGSVFA